MKCPLSQSNAVEHIFSREDKAWGRRDYWFCPETHLTFLAPDGQLAAQHEKERYDLHQNNPEDEGYVSFLKQLTNPLLKHLKSECCGLDYGCGPGPTIQPILAEQGFSVANYDPFYYPDEGLLDQTYPFITCTEVVEHFYRPREDFLKLDRLLAKGGVLGVMTQMRQPEKNFGEWWYPTEPTHVCFYQRETFEWIARWLNWAVEFPAKNITLFYK